VLQWHIQHKVLGLSNQLCDKTLEGFVFTKDQTAEITLEAFAEVMLAFWLVAVNFCSVFIKS